MMSLVTRSCSSAWAASRHRKSRYSASGMRTRVWPACSSSAQAPPTRCSPHTMGHSPTRPRRLPAPCGIAATSRAAPSTQASASCAPAHPASSPASLRRSASRAVRGAASTTSPASRRMNSPSTSATAQGSLSRSGATTATSRCPRSSRMERMTRSYWPSASAPSEEGSSSWRRAAAVSLPCWKAPGVEGAATGASSSVRYAEPPATHAAVASRPSPASPMRPSAAASASPRVSANVRYSLAVVSRRPSSSVSSEVRASATSMPWLRIQPATSSP